MLQFMAFCFVLSVVLLLSQGAAGAALVFFCLMVITPVVYAGWVLLKPHRHH